jgi:hypothetical protein
LYPAKPTKQLQAMSSKHGALCKPKGKTLLGFFNFIAIKTMQLKPTQQRTSSQLPLAACPRRIYKHLCITICLTVELLGFPDLCKTVSLHAKKQTKPGMSLSSAPRPSWPLLPAPHAYMSPSLVTA